MRASWPDGTISASTIAAPPVNASVGAPERVTTPMSFMKTPCRKPVPTALLKASLAAKRLAYVPAMVKGRGAPWRARSR